MRPSQSWTMTSVFRRQREPQFLPHDSSRTARAVTLIDRLLSGRPQCYDAGGAEVRPMAEELTLPQYESAPKRGPVTDQLRGCVFAKE